MPETAPSTAQASLRRAVNQDDSLRIVSVVATAPVQELCARSDIRGREAIVAGRALMCAYLLATVAKNEDERVRLQLRGGGPVGTVVADAHGDGRGRAALQARLGSLSLDPPELKGEASADRTKIADLVGSDGQLTVTRDMGLRRPYQGTVELYSGELDEDVEQYLTHSEQLASALRCAVWLDEHGEVVAAGGVMVQAFPGSDPALVEQVGDRLRSAPLASIAPHELTHSSLGRAAVGQQGFRTVHEHALRFECGCGPNNARRVVSSLGAEDLEALANEQEQTEVRCNYCSRVTVLDADDLREVARKLRYSKQSPTVH